MTSTGKADPAARAAGWRVAHWILTAIFVLAAGLNMAGVRAGFLTSHAADLVVPAWLYVTVRRLAGGARSGGAVQRWLGATPERAALTLFAASALTEVSQIYWPRGLFRGVFDPLDLLAFAAGLAACYAVDRRSTPRAGRRAGFAATSDPRV